MTTMTDAELDALVVRLEASSVGNGMILRNPDGPKAAAALTTLRKQIDTLYQAIAHGDEDHRAWLKEAIEAHFADEPVPEPRGQGRKEAEIAALRKQRDELREAHQRIKSDRHDEGCQYDYCPRNECPTCPSAAQISRQALSNIEEPRNDHS